MAMIEKDSPLSPLSEDLIDNGYAHPHKAAIGLVAAEVIAESAASDFKVSEAP